MSSPREPRSCALHVLDPATRDGRPDLVALLGALGDHVTELTLHVEDRDVVDALHRDASRSLRRMVVLPSGCSRRAARTVRHAAARTGAHVAVVPIAEPLPGDDREVTR